MSTFGSLNTAYRGLSAARAGLDVVGQNITNATTEGYTRQRVTTSSISGATVGLFSQGSKVGQGVSIDGIARLGDATLDTQVRATASSSGYSTVRSGVLSNVETSLNEPGSNGLSSQLTKFWSAWQGVSNAPTDSAAASTLLAQASDLASTLSDGYQAVSDQYAATRTQVASMATELNQNASQIADLNVQIRQGLTTGQNVNELVDHRALLTENVAKLAGGTVHANSDGTVDVLIGGNALVSGDTARPVSVTGSLTLAGTAGAPVQLQWDHRPGASVGLDGGELAGALSVLAPADGQGSGGFLAETAAGYNAFATQLATAVNAVHQTGTTASGTTNTDFFGISATAPAAQGLTVLPKDAASIASRATGLGANNGSVADQISQIGTGAAAPDRAWSTFVTTIGSQAKSEISASTRATNAAVSAKTQQASVAGVDLDEENVNMVTFQHAYQGAARMMTAVDEMLDTLINHLGHVGTA